MYYRLDLNISCKNVNALGGLVQELQDDAYRQTLGNGVKEIFNISVPTLINTMLYIRNIGHQRVNSYDIKTFRFFVYSTCYKCWNIRANVGRFEGYLSPDCFQKTSVN